MDAQERLRQVIDQQQRHLRMDVPSDGSAAVLALLRLQDGLPHQPLAPLPDLITGHRLASPGASKALQFCLESSNDQADTASTYPASRLAGWGEHFLQACDRLVTAAQVLMQIETGSMRMVDDGAGTFDAWITTKRAPASWQPRLDIDWWAASLAKRHEPELHLLRAERPGTEGSDDASRAWYHRLANAYLKMMAYQVGYPPETVIGGCTIQIYRDVLAELIVRGLQLRARDRGEAVALRSERALVAAIAAAVGVDPVVIGRAVDAFTLDRERAALHAAVPGVAAAPLVRVGPDQIAYSVYGLTTEPLFFLSRELKRRDAEAYHNAAHNREPLFRQDLYALFQDKRFVTSTDRVKVRREGGDLRTDIDALIFDRKTGTLGIFELKSQDPFARSAAEMARQRDNLLYANRQIAGVLAWLKRYGADSLLGRVDSRTAKTFRAHKVYPFVLGRYLAHLHDGAEPDRRAAWGTWPQLLRLIEAQPLRGSDANPIASLFNRLTNDDPFRPPAADYPRREIAIGDAHLTVHPSYAAYRASMGNTH